MKILAFEFSTPLRSVAVADGAQVLSRTLHAHGRETPCLTLIEQALRQAAVERTAIEAVAVGLGPGSYTGIRMSLALAQGWELGQGVKVLGVPTAEVLALQAAELGMTGRTAVMIDAQRGEWYAAVYEVSGGSSVEVSQLALLDLAAAQALIQTVSSVVGPGIAAHFPGGVDLYPDAGLVARLAQLPRVTGAGETLEPIYLRPVEFVKAPSPRQID